LTVLFWAGFFSVFSVVFFSVSKISSLHQGDVAALRSAGFPDNIQKRACCPAIPEGMPNDVITMGW
jgi:hypothetical protein